ncbi:unnamed protein product [Closterium sp. NIES-65]|nr:unnamed protein product [Closterium sp. NIES-65]
MARMWRSEKDGGAEADAADSPRILFHPLPFHPLLLHLPYLPYLPPLPLLLLSPPPSLPTPFLPFSARVQVKAAWEQLGKAVEDARGMAGSVEAGKRKQAEMERETAAAREAMEGLQKDLSSRNTQMVEVEEKLESERWVGIGVYLFWEPGRKCVYEMIKVQVVEVEEKLEGEPFLKRVNDSIRSRLPSCPFSLQEQAEASGGGEGRFICTTGEAGAVDGAGRGVGGPIGGAAAGGAAAIQVHHEMLRVPRPTKGAQLMCMKYPCSSSIPPSPTVRPPTALSLPLPCPSS